MDIPISSTEAARNLGDCLARIRHTGDRFILSRNDKPVAVLGPLPGSGRVTLRELVDLWSEGPKDDTFADDLSRANAMDQIPENP